jgi:cellulose synthase/poly-beta-1,6-N-acetylglucosamine synthase-like glycosyltransferase
MYAAILSLWTGSILGFGPEAIGIVTSTEGVLAKSVVGFLLISIAVFWLYGIYNIVVQVFGYLPRSKPEKLSLEEAREMDAAILLPTFNDFSWETAKDCVNQVHDATLYILDDSTDQEYRELVDEFVESHDAVEVIRRDNRDGFKAGALNHAIQGIDAEYFAVVDSDERVPTGFLRQMLRYFSRPEVGLSRRITIPTVRIRGLPSYWGRHSF